ncbi:MAG TPA: glycoside hydrolase family 2 TIM barrel-domain containing protein [Candidatus Omnitrophota bacterium]|nr:glycoside hydrolase family 2 TIM barrel-domain containing protein [Candidatus Omnitrophota bacterium]
MKKNLYLSIVATVLFSMFFLSQASAQILSSQEYVRKAWEASSQNNFEEVDRLTDECVLHYNDQAKQQQASLTGFADKGTESQYQALNDVATALFIHAESLMKQGKTEDSRKLFMRIIEEFSWAQSWDPRGWYWAPAEKAQASIDKLDGKYEQKQVVKVDRGPKTLPTLSFPGAEKIIDYKKYGHFVGVGTKEYEYVIDDPEGLMKAVGQCIYPNTSSLLKDPVYRQMVKDGKLGGSHWDFVHTDDLQKAVYKWASSSENWGVKLFYMGLLFERAHMWYEAIKCYRAIQIHFPQSVGRTYWNTPWYPGQAAIAKIRHLINIRPELDLKYVGAKIQVINGFDNDVANDIVLTWPGELRKKNIWDKVQEKFASFFPEKQCVFSPSNSKKVLGAGRVRLLQCKESGHWQLQIDEKPAMIKAVTYVATKVGQSPDNGTLADWMVEDTNHNGKPDGPFDSWVDKNRNNKQDSDEPVVGDFQLLKEMGVNAIRIYKQPYNADKELLRKLYNDYGIMVIMGDFLGKYALGSGASWFEGTDYDNPEHKKNMMESVRKMVEEFKDEPYVLFWLLGNENNYGLGCNADKKPESYFKFVEEVAQMIKSIDKNHLVAVCNGDTLFLDIFAENCPSVDIFGANAYRGDYGFGSYWAQVFELTGRPAFITEYGCPAYANFLSPEEAEQAQADYHQGAWEDMLFNAAGSKEGVGNALGGVVFEWMDEWWKNYEPYYHDKTAGAKGPFPDGFMYEEWFGIIGQGDGSHSPFLRQLRKAYEYYKKAWN